MQKNKQQLIHQTNKTMKHENYTFTLDGYEFSADFEITDKGCEIEKAELLASPDLHIEITDENRLKLIKSALDAEFSEEIDEAIEQARIDDEVDAAEMKWEAKMGK